MKIKTVNLGKRYNREWIFRNLTVELTDGIYAVTGPNGSGKSTLLQVLWGQLPASQGTIEYQDGDTSIPLTDIYKKLAIATPYMELIDEFTLTEMVNFHFKFKKYRQELAATKILDWMELSHAKNKTIQKLSSGMKQRLKLGLALSTQASIIFLDEPGTNLDKNAFNWYWNRLMSLPKNILVVIASNQEHEYPENCQKISIPDYK